MRSFPRFGVLVSASIASAALGVLGLAGCDSTIETATGSGGSGGSTSANTTSAMSTTVATSTSTSSGMQSGECSTAADCNGAPCIELTPGGYTVCASMPDEATMCQGAGADECCDSTDCAAGACYEAVDLQFCGGAFPAFNVCVDDACTTDADCTASSTNSICAPASAFGQPKRFCMTAYCKTDADCTAEAGGVCRLVGNDPCCSHPAPDGLACVYPGDCALDADCPNDGTCHLDANGASQCGPPNMGCPP